MPDTRLTFDPQHCLLDVDSTADECNALLDTAAAVKRRFTGLWSHVLELKNTLENKDLELRRVADRQAADSDCWEDTVASLEGRFSVQCQKVQKQKQQMERLRRRNKQLADDLKTSNKKLEQMQHLRCDVCLEDVKAVVTRCGHGFCKACLATHLGGPPRSGFGLADLALDPSSTSRCPCPMCRKSISPEADVWRIYLDEGQFNLQPGATEDESD